jgi:hypothetical protein
MAGSIADISDILCYELVSTRSGFAKDGSGTCDM